MASDLIATVTTTVNATGEGDMTPLFFTSPGFGVSFLCSILEAVVLSTPQTYVNILQNEGKTAEMWAHLKETILFDRSRPSSRSIP